jgi:hypothetical protein
MIEQHDNQLVLTFPSPETAGAFAQFLQVLLQLAVPVISLLPSAPSPDLAPQSPTPASPEPARSRHTVLTDERLEALSNQRAQGMTAHQRLLRAQATLRDGVLPFRKLPSQPQPTGQPSPRQKAALEGGFADGSGDPPEAGRRRSQLKRVQPVPPPPPFPPAS